VTTFRNVYEDTVRAEAYSRLEFPGTYFLAYRDLPEILSRHVVGGSVVDFGCGAGRSTRFLRRGGSRDRAEAGVTVLKRTRSFATRADRGRSGD
jgi:hypothetical protein